MTDEYICKQDVVDKINANADDLEQNGCIPYAQGARAMAIVVEQIPPADVVPVVRCKDCKYNATTHKCLNPDSFFLIPKDDDFCSFGERREE